MASSTYKVMCSLSYDYSRRAPTEEYIKGTLSGDSYVEISIDNSRIHINREMLKERPYVFLTDGNHHTCRETALGSLVQLRDYVESRPDIFQKGLYSTNYGILYYQENGRSIDSERIELVREFSDTVLMEKGEFSIINDNMIFYNFHEYSQDFAVRVSLLLYVFRRIFLLKKLMEALRDEQRKSFAGNSKMASKVAFALLIQIFLEFPNQCDGSNPAMMLAYFSWLYYSNRAHSLDYVVTCGPVHAVQKVSSARSMLKFYTEFVHRTVNDDNLQYCMRQMSDSYTGVMEDFGLIKKLVTMEERT